MDAEKNFMNQLTLKAIASTNLLILKQLQPTLKTAKGWICFPRLELHGGKRAQGYMAYGLTGWGAEILQTHPIYIISRVYTQILYNDWHIRIYPMSHPPIWEISRKCYPCLEYLTAKNPPIWAAHTRTSNM